MKKTILAILLTFACALSLFAFTGCDPLHHPVPYSGAAPTCTETGLVQGEICEICGLILKQPESIAPLGHEFCDEDNTCHRLTASGEICGEVKITPSTYFSFELVEEAKTLADGTYVGPGYELSVKNPGELPICIVLPENYGDSRVVALADACFAGCNDLIRVVLPTSVTEIGYGAFARCPSLKEIIVAEDNENYCAVDGVLYNKTMDTLIQFPQSLVEDTADGEQLVTSFEVPDTVRTIGDFAFFESKLEQVTFQAASVTTINHSAFRNCDLLEGMLFPNSVETISSYAFEGCDSLIAIEFGVNTTYVGESSFAACSALKLVVIPHSTNAVNIHLAAFVDCPSIAQFFVAENHPSHSSIDGNLYNNDGSTLVLCATADDNAIVISKDVELLASRAFTNCAEDLVIYYEGNADEWNAINVGLWNDVLDSATIYLYSETQPEGEGTFWHYVNNEIVVWEIATE